VSKEFNHIALLGGSGYIGQTFIECALKRGIRIKALTRSSEKLMAYEGKVEILTGSLFNETDLGSLVAGTNAVVSLAGPPLSGKFEIEDYTSGMRKLIKVMQEQDINRVINIAGASVKLSNEAFVRKKAMIRATAGLIINKALKTKDVELDLLSSSNLNWTTIRPGFVRKHKKGQFIADHDKLHSLSVDKEQLANFILDCLDNRIWELKAPFVATI
jgi:putative NADH-flavin reductase